MVMEVLGHRLYSHFIFVCDGKVYTSNRGKQWAVNFKRSGTMAWGNMTWGEQDVTRPCPEGRNEEVHQAFRGAVMRHFRLNHKEFDAFMQRQVTEDKQILVEGNSVKRHISGSSSFTTKAATPTPAAPVKKEAPRVLASDPAIKYGCPPDRVLEFRAWYKEHSKDMYGVKLVDAIKMFLGTWVEPEAPQAEEPQPETRRIDMTYIGYESGIRWVRQNKRRRWGYRIKKSQAMEVLGVELPDNIFQATKGWSESYRWDSRDAAASALFELLTGLTGFEFYVGTITPEPAPVSLVEEREHKADVPFYGRRRRDQAAFRDDVELNCFNRCVVTGASRHRCEAAHLVPHARKGGASFKNGLLLRSDIHKLFDKGLCAIHPQTLCVYFCDELLAENEDLLPLEGQRIADTLKPINRDNLKERWEAFNA